MRTRTQLLFRIWGPDLDPDALTRSIGVQPTESFRVGESQGAAASKVAGWEWHSRWGDWDSEPLVAEMLHILQPHQSSIRAVVEEGATVHVTVRAVVLADLVQSREESEARGLYTRDDDTFPDLEADDPSIALEPPAFEFLGAISALFTTYLEFGLDDPEWDTFIGDPD